MTTYFFKKPVGPSDWRALPREFKAGEIAERFSGHTYGLCRDDMMYGGHETIAIRDGEAFFTCPVEFLEDEKGRSPMGEYVRLPQHTSTEQAPKP